MYYVFAKKVELTNQLVSVSHGASGKHLLDLKTRSSSFHLSLIKRLFESDGFEAYKDVTFFNVHASLVNLESPYFD